MRKQPNIAAPTTFNTQPPTGVITQVREYELITPLFGGGVQKGENDLLTLIRGSEIRGNLRFWWRACRGGQFNGDLTTMKKKEDSIWGAAYKKGTDPLSREKTIQISVTKCSSQGSIAPYDKSQPFRLNIPLYAAFPLQLSDADMRAGISQREVKNKVSFTLTLSFPETYKKDVEAALWAWETFGGIGARTRRGFGALRCLNIEENKKVVPLQQPSPKESVGYWIQSMLKEYGVKGIWPSNVPHLSETFVEGTDFRLTHQLNNQDAITIWSNLINTLKSFRQMRYTSTKFGAKNPGRSMWPEPSTIRHLTEQSSTHHSSPIPNPPIYKFPRAVFGLPIIFQFKDSNRNYPNDKRYDPRKTVLQLKKYERFSSPLILKPLAWKNRTCVGLVVILKGSRLPEEQLELKTQEGYEERWDVTASLEQNQKLTLNSSERTPPTNVNSQTDVLKAFMNYLERNNR